MRIKVEPGRRFLTWFKWTPLKELSPELRDFIRKENPKADCAWFPAYLEELPSKKTCRMCGNLTLVYTKGLCEDCFRIVSYLLLKGGLLVRMTDFTWDSMPRFSKFLTRFGRPKIWLHADDGYGIKPGREKDFYLIVDELIDQDRGGE